MGYYKRKAGAAALQAFAIYIGVLLISAWPWLLGTHIAETNGAHKGTLAYDLAGWIPEVIWIVAVIGVAIAIQVVKRLFGFERG